MFELQNPTTVLEWLGEKSLCVACQQNGGKTEILKLSLPGKLQSAVTDKDLCKDRDFVVEEGGFHDYPLRDLHYLASTGKLITTGEEDDSVLVWHLGKDKTDLIKREVTLHNKLPENQPASVAVLDDDPTRVAFGSRLHNICVTDLTDVNLLSNITDSTPSEELCDLHAVDTNTLVACTKYRQKAWYLDIRSNPSVPSIIISSSKDSNSREPKQYKWSSCLHKKSLDTPCSRDVHELWTTDSDGMITVWDCRQPSECVGRVTALPNSSANSKRHLHIQVSPSGNEVSVSGYNGCVYIYDAEDIRRANAKSQTSPIFVHRGHDACAEERRTTVLAHIWHATLPQCVFSSASDGSLHAWQYKI